MRKGKTMNYRVKIKSPNKMFVIKDKPVRSPFECIIPDSHLPLIQSRIKFYGLQSRDYEIELIDHNNLYTDNNQKKDYDCIPSEREPDKKERTIKRVSNSKPSVKIENTVVEDHSTIKPIQKNIKREEKVVHKKQEAIKLPISAKKEIQDVKLKVYHELDKKPEQNINNDIKLQMDNSSLLNNNFHNDDLDVEVKIEELTIKSSSILEKFLNSEL
jgi:hypothetical protein